MPSPFTVVQRCPPGNPLPPPGQKRITCRWEWRAFWSCLDDKWITDPSAVFPALKNEWGRSGYPLPTDRRPHGVWYVGKNCCWGNANPEETAGCFRAGAITDSSGWPVDQWILWKSTPRGYPNTGLCEIRCLTTFDMWGNAGPLPPEEFCTDCRMPTLPEEFIVPPLPLREEVVHLRCGCKEKYILDQCTTCDGRRSPGVSPKGLTSEWDIFGGSSPANGKVVNFYGRCYTLWPKYEWDRRFPNAPAPYSYSSLPRGCTTVLSYNPAFSSCWLNFWPFYDNSCDACMNSGYTIRAYKCANAPLMAGLIGGRNLPASTVDLSLNAQEKADMDVLTTSTVPGDTSTVVAYRRVALSICAMEFFKDPAFRKVTYMGSDNVCRVMELVGNPPCGADRISRKYIRGTINIMSLISGAFGFNMAGFPNARGHCSSAGPRPNALGVYVDCGACVSGIPTQPGCKDFKVEGALLLNVADRNRDFPTAGTIDVFSTYVGTNIKIGMTFHGGTNDTYPITWRIERKPFGVGRPFVIVKEGVFPVETGVRNVLIGGIAGNRFFRPAVAADQGDYKIFVKNAGGEILCREFSIGVRVPPPELPACLPHSPATAIRMVNVSIWAAGFGSGITGIGAGPAEWHWLAPPDGKNSLNFISKCYKNDGDWCDLEGRKGQWFLNDSSNIGDPAICSCFKLNHSFPACGLTKTSTYPVAGSAPGSISPIEDGTGAPIYMANPVLWRSRVSRLVDPLTNKRTYYYNVTTMGAQCALNPIAWYGSGEDCMKAKDDFDCSFTAGGPVPAAPLNMRGGFGPFGGDC